MRRLALSAVPVAALLLLTGCGKAATPVDTVAGGGPGASGQLKRIAPIACPSPDVLMSGLEANQPDAADVLPAGFTTSEVLLCTIEYREIDGAPAAPFLVTKRATGDVNTFTALETELRTPSDPIGIDVMCTMDLRLVPWFEMLAIGDQSMRPAVPTDVCGKPRSSALDALNALTFTEESAVAVELERGGRDGARRGNHGHDGRRAERRRRRRGSLTHPRVGRSADPLPRPAATGPA